MRATAKALVFCLCLIASALAQNPAKEPVFDSASIKPAGPDTGHSGWHTRPGYLVLQNQSLHGIIGIAWQTAPERVTGGPPWGTTERFDIEARADGPAGEAELLAMLRSLLVERFGLATHRASVVSRGLAMLPVKGGLKVAADAGEGSSSSHSTRGKYEAQRVPLSFLADFLSRKLGVPVVDETGAQGRYSFGLDWEIEAGTTADSAIIPVLRQVLGIRLEDRKLPIEMVVIDAAKRPESN